MLVDISGIYIYLGILATAIINVDVDIIYILEVSEVNYRGIEMLVIVR